MIKSIGFSPLVIGIALGIIYANSLHHNAPASIPYAGEEMAHTAVIVKMTSIAIGLNSLFKSYLAAEIVTIINTIDTFLLTMAMTALGMGTIFSKFKGVGAGSFFTALAMFVWLVVGGFVITKSICT